MRNEVTIYLAKVPPSINTNRIRSHWTGFHTEKKRWQRELEYLLMAERLPRPLPADDLVDVHATLFFAQRRRRDTENYRVLLSKALGDALVNGGWLLDDTDDHWRLTVVAHPEPAETHTEIRLRWLGGLGSQREMRHAEDRADITEWGHAG